MHVIAEFLIAAALPTIAFVMRSDQGFREDHRSRAEAGARPHTVGKEEWGEARLPLVMPLNSKPTNTGDSW